MDAIDTLTLGVPGKEPAIPPSITPIPPPPLQDTAPPTPLPEPAQALKPEPTPARSAIDELTVAKEPEVSPIDKLTLAPVQDNADLLYGPYPGAKLKPEAERDVFGRGITAGGYQTKMALTAISGLAKKAFGDENGFRDSMSLAAMYDNQASALAPKYGIIDSVRKGTIGDTFSALGFALGEQLPNIMTMIASGGAGGTLAKMAATAYTRKIISKEIRDEIIAKAVQRATVVGALVGTTAIETGGTATEAYEATGDVNIPVAVGAGLLKGAGEVVVPFGLAKKLGFGKAIDAGLMEMIGGAVERKLGGGALAKITGGAVSAGIEEATTEGLQETVDAAARAYVDKNYKFLSAATRDRILEAIASGGLVGAVFGGATGGGHGAHAAEAPTPTDQVIADRTAAAATGQATPAAPTAAVGTPPATTTATDGAVRNVANGPLPTLDDLPKKVDLATLRATPGLIIPDAAIPHITQAIMSRNAVARAPGRNIAPAVTAKAQQAADAALAAAHKAGLRYAGTPADTTVLPGGTAVGGGAAATPTGATTATVPPQVAQVAGAAPGTAGVVGPPATGSQAIPTAAGGQGAVPPPTTTPATAAPQVDPAVAAHTAQAIPKHHNPHIDAMLQGFRDIINRQGGLAKLDPRVQKGFTSDAPQAALLGGVRGHIEHTARLAAVRSTGRPMQDVQARLNLDTGNVDVAIAHSKGANSYTVPTAELLQKKAEEYITEKMNAGMRVLDQKVLDKARADAFRPGDRLIQHKTLLVDEVGPTVYTLNGEVIHPDDLAPGQVAIANTDPSKTIGAAQLKYIQRLINRFMPGQKLIIRFTNGRDISGSAYAGYYMRIQDNNNVIALNHTLANTYNQATPFRMVSTLYHELGHMLVHHIFQNEPLAVQTALYNAWVADMNRPGTIYDLALGTASINRMSGLVQTPSTTFGKHEQGFLDWFNFDEWMSEQISRYHMTNEKAVGVVDKYFKNAAQKLKDMWGNLFGLYKEKTGETFEANAVVAGWLESLYKNRITGQSIAGPTIMESMKESAMENLKYSNIKLDPLLNSFEDLIAAAPPESPASAGIRRLAPLFPPGTAGPIVAQADKYNGWIRITWNLLQIAQANLGIGSLQQYVGYVRQWAITRMQLISRANTTLKLWRQLGREMGQNLNDFLFDIDSMSYLPAGARSRWPSPAELAALAQRHNLNPQAIAVYDSIKGQFSEILDRLERAWLQDAAMIRDPIAQAQKVMEINREMQLLRIKPYFPHSRFGDWTMSIRDARGKLVNFQQFESKRARDDAMAPARAAHPGHTVTGDKMPGEMRQFNGIPPGVLRSLQTRLGLTPQQQTWLDNFVFDMSPANSFAKKFKKRKNIKGYSNNAQQAFADYFTHVAGHIARLEYGQQMQQSVDDTRLSARGDLTGKRQDIGDWMQRHLDYIMHPPNEWTAVRSIAFLHYLSYSVGAMVLNLTQVPMVAAPYLSSRFGNLKIIPAFTRTGLDIRKLYDDPANSRLAIDESTALDEGTAQGFIDQAQASELAAASEGSAVMKMLAGTAYQQVLGHAAHWSSYLFQAAEKMNRKVVFMTGYRLAKDNPTAPHLAQLEAANQAQFQDLLAKGWAPENARAFLAGRDAVDKTQFEYARWNRPEFMRGKKGIIFTFYMYKQNMLHFFRHQPGGYKALALLMAFAGLQGLPWEEEINEVIRYITGQLSGFGVPRFDFNAEMRKFLTQLTDRPDIIMHGLGRETWGWGLLGEAMGIPIPSVDVSQSMGMGQVDPIVHPLIHGLETGQSFPEQVGNVAMGALGATFGVGLGYAKMLESGDLSSIRAWMPALPRFIKNVVQAIDLANSGGYVNAAGAKLVPFDLSDTKTMAEIIMQGMGFTPTRIAQQRELTTAQLDAYKFWTIRRNILLDNLWKAYQAHDMDALNAVKARIRYFNSTAPDPRLKLGQESLLSSMRTRQKNIKKMEQDKAPNKVLQGVGAQVRSLYPEVQ
jgi:hypothetical protein